MKLIIVVSLIGLTFIACRNEVKEKKNDAPEEKTEYFPIQEYLLGEIRTVDSLPVGILKKHTINNKLDSGFIQPAEFNRLANAFLDSSLEKNSFAQNYSESSFADESTGYITFTYEPRSEKSVVTRIDLMAKPGAITASVKTIYMEKRYMKADSSIHEKLYWKSNSNFWIRKETTYKDSPAIVEHLQVIWNPEDY